MPVVRRGDGDGVNLLVLEQFADVPVTFDLLIAFAERLDARVEDFAVHIAKGDDTNVFAGQSAHAADVVLAAPAESDNGDANGSVGAANTGPGISGQAEGGGGESGAFQEGSAIHGFHNYQWISPAVVVVAFN